MREKKTKGKQKISIKKVEKDEDRMVTFSKRRSGIYTKLSELSVLCGAEVGFLVYSGAGKPYTFGNPSFEAVAQRFLNGEGPSSSAILDAHKKVRMEELCKTYNKVMEEADAEEERGKNAAAALAPSMAVESKAWWKVEPKNEEEAKRLLGQFEQFYEKLCEVAAAKNNGEGNGASTSSFPQGL